MTGRSKRKAIENTSALSTQQNRLLQACGLLQNVVRPLLEQKTAVSRVGRGLTLACGGGTHTGCCVTFITSKVTEPIEIHRTRTKPQRFGCRRKTTPTGVEPRSGGAKISSLPKHLSEGRKSVWERVHYLALDEHYVALHEHYLALHSTASHYKHYIVCTS